MNSSTCEEDFILISNPDGSKKAQILQDPGSTKNNSSQATHQIFSTRPISSTAAMFDNRDDI